MDGGAWWAAVHGVRKESDTTERLHFHFSLSCIGEGNGNPLQCSCLENPRDVGAWWALVYGVAQSQTWLKWLSSSWLFAWKLPSVPVCVGSSSIPVHFIKHASQEGNRGTASKRKVAILHKLIMEMTSHDLCCTLLVRSQSLGQPIFKGRGIYQCMNTWRQRSWGAILGAGGLPAAGGS